MAATRARRTRVATITGSAAQKVLDDLLDGTFLGLHTADPGDGGAHEMRGRRYQRQLAKWEPATGDGRKSNADQLVWPDVPMEAVAYVVAWTAETGGEPRWTFRFPKPVQPPLGAQAFLVFVNAGSLTAVLRAVAE